MQFTFVFTEEDLHILNMALIEIPTKYGAPMIAKINEQIKAQNNQSTTPTSQSPLTENMS